MMNRRNRAWLIYPIILLGAALRFFRLGYFSLWDGEIFTLFISQKELTQILPALRDFGAHPPMWFFITRAFDAFGWNEWMLRAPAALAGIFAIPAIYIAGKRGANTTTGLIAALLLACAPLAVLYSQVGRMYSIVIPLAALLIYASQRAVMTRAWRWWFALAFISALLLYNHYLALIAVGSAYLMIGIVLLAQSWRAVNGLRVRPLFADFFKRSARLWVSVGVFILFILPLIPFMLKNFFQRQLGREAASNFNAVTVNLEFLRALFLDLAGNEWLLLLSGALILAGLLLSLRRRDFRSLLLAVTWFGAVFLVVTIIHPRRFPSRYVLYLVPVYILLTAHGIVLLSEWASRVLARITPRLTAKQTAAVLALLFTALFIILAARELVGMYRGTQEVSRGERTTALLLNGGWRELSNYLSENVAPGDVIVYAGDGALRPPRFIAPYVSSAYQTRAHSAPASKNAAQQIWWVGVNLRADDIVNPTNTKVAPLLSFGDTSIARAVRPVEWQAMPLPIHLEDWQVQVEPDKPGLTLGETAEGSNPPIWHFDLTAPVNARLQSELLPVTPGQLFRASIKVRGVSEGFYDFSPGLNFQFFDAQQNRITDNGAQTLLPRDEQGWQTLVLDGVVPRGAVRARLVIELDDYSFTYAPNVELSEIQWLLENVAAP